MVLIVVVIGGIAIFDLDLHSGRKKKEKGELQVKENTVGAFSLNAP